MDQLRAIRLHVNLLEFESAFAGICEILKAEKNFTKSEISEIVEVYFKIPKDLKVTHREQIKKILKIFFKFQASTLNFVDKKRILHEFKSLNRHDIWYAQEYIEVCLALGEVEVAREQFHEIVDRAFSFKRIGLIENLCKKFHELIDESEQHRIMLMCACMRHDKTLVEQMYKQTFTSNEKRIIFRKVIEESSEAAIITPEGLEISNLKQQISKKITLDARKKIVNKLYEFLAMGNSKHEILLLCAEYFIKVKRKKVAQQIIDFANICLSNDSSFEPRIKEMQEKIKKEKEDKEFQLEKDEIFDLAEDLFSGDLDVLFEGEKKHAYTLDMSLMERDAYLIRKGLVAIDEIANKELKKFPAESENSNRKLEKSLVNAFMDIDLPVKLELYRDLVSALIMFEMLDPALKLCEELMPDLSGIENRISITYLIVMIYFKKENYNRVIELCNSTIASLPLSASDKIAFLRLMAASFQKKGEIKNSIGVNKLIDQIISASNEVHE